jgi:alkylated DNA repair dioxygenase AlkB
MQPTFGNLPAPNIQHALLDSFIVPGFLETALGIDESALFANLQDTAPWTDPSDPDFKYRGNELARKKAFLVSSADPVPRIDGEPMEMPKYSYPGWQNASMRSYRDMRTVPSLDNIVEKIKQEFLYNGRPVNINHAILTCYRGADDNIGWHADKVISFRPIQDF